MSKYDVKSKVNPLYIETKSERLQLLVTPSLKKALKEKAKSQSRSVNDLINSILEDTVNSQANALLIKYVLEKDSQHKVVIADLLEKTNKKKRKLKAVTNGEFCRKWKEAHIFCRKDDVKCPFYGVVDCRPSSFKKNPFQTKDGKYILIEVKE